MSAATVHELLKLRKALEEEPQDAGNVLDLLDQAATLQVTPQLLHQTLLGRTLSSLKKSQHSEVSQRAKEIVLTWKSMVLTEKTSTVKPQSSSVNLVQSTPSRTQSCPSVAIPNPQASPQRSISAPQPVQKVSKSIPPPSPTPSTSSAPPPSPTPSIVPLSPAPARAPSTAPVSPASSTASSRLSDALLSITEEECSNIVYKLNSTDNKVRNKIQELFFGVFAEASELVKTELAVRLEASLFAKHKACNTEYRDHSREILGNLKDPKNPALKLHLLSGAWTTEELIGPLAAAKGAVCSHGAFDPYESREMPEACLDFATPTMDHSGTVTLNAWVSAGVGKSVYELAADDLKKQREENAAWMDGWRRTDWQQANRPKGGCDLFKCAKCGARDTTYTQKQTRSADEPMTTFVLCNNCGKRWKMY